MGIGKTPAKPFKADFIELGRIHDFYHVTGAERSSADIRHEIR